MRFTGSLAASIAPALLGLVGVLLPACVAPEASSEGEPLAETSSALCTVNSAPGSNCSGGSTGANLPYASYLTTTTTDISATLNFLTQRGASATMVTFTSATPSAALPASVSDTGGTSHNLVVSGLTPSTKYGFTIFVGRTLALTGTLTTQAGPAIGITAPLMIQVIEQATTAQLPITLTGVSDHTVHGVLHVNTSGWSSIVIPDTPVTLSPNEKLTVILPVTLPNAVADTDDSDADLGEINLTTTFAYEQRAPVVPTLLRTYPQFLMMGTDPQSQETAYQAPSCDEMNASGLVTLRPGSGVSLMFAWNAESFSYDTSKAVLFTVYWRGKVLTQGVYPQTQQSAVYFEPSSLFLSNYGGSDFTDIQDDQWADHDSIAFTCAQVPASTVLP